jgi:hypothetical protein
MADSPPPRLPTTSNAHPSTVGHLGDGVEAAGAAIEAIQPPTTTAEIAPFGGMFSDDASAVPTKAATPSTPLPTTSNHRTVAPGHLCDRAAAAGLQTKQSQPPQLSRMDAPWQFGILITSAATTMATTTSPHLPTPSIL